MNTMIPNPTKTLVIKKNIEVVKDRLSYMEKWSGQKSGINIVGSSFDENLNTYNFVSQVYIYGKKLVDLGDYGNVMLEEIDKNTTKLTIEMGKNQGCISDENEASDVNIQMRSFLKLFSSLLDKSEEELKNPPKKNDFGCLLWSVLAIVLFTGICLVCCVLE